MSTLFRIRTLILVAIICAAAKACWRPVMAWTERRCGVPEPECPVTAIEQDFLKMWSDVDREPSRSMVTEPFSIHAKSLEQTPTVESITIENTSRSAIRDFWFYRAGAPNFYSAQTLVDSVTATETTETGKAMALWSLFPRYYYNYYPNSFVSMLFDPPTQLAVLGTAQCNFAVSVLETLCQMAGLETRPGGITYQRNGQAIAHCVMEVKADGRWIYLDPDGHSAYRMADGRWAGMEDLRRNPELVLTCPHAYYETAFLAEAFAKGEVGVSDTSERDAFSLARRQTATDLYSKARHVMRFDLLPGAKTVLYPGVHRRSFNMELPLYANGVLTWTCRPHNFANGWHSGILMRNVAATATADGVVLRPCQSRRPASIIIPITSPYLMVGGRIAGVIKTAKNLQVRMAPFTRVVHATEDGWLALGELTNGSTSLFFDGIIDKEPLFGYALRISIPASGVTFRSLDIMTWLQCAPRALPRLEAGENTFNLYAENPVRPVVSESAVPGVKFENGLRITFDLARPPQASAP